MQFDGKLLFEYFDLKDRLRWLEERLLEGQSGDRGATLVFPEHPNGAYLLARYIHERSYEVESFVLELDECFPPKEESPRAWTTRRISADVRCREIASIVGDFQLRQLSISAHDAAVISILGENNSPCLATLEKVSIVASSRAPTMEGFQGWSTFARMPRLRELALSGFLLGSGELQEIGKLKLSELTLDLPGPFKTGLLSPLQHMKGRITLFISADHDLWNEEIKLLHFDGHLAAYIR